MEGLQARESHGELGVWKDGSGFHMERGLEGIKLGAFSTGRQLGWDCGKGRRCGRERCPGHRVNLPWDWLAAVWGERVKSWTRPLAGGVRGWW